VLLTLLAITLALSVVPQASGGQDQKISAQVPGRPRQSKPPKPPRCGRNNSVGFSSNPELLSELGRVYANCDAHPACPNPTNLTTKQIDGYSSTTYPYGWLWTGDMTTTFFNVAQQDAIITDAVTRAGLVAPRGQVIVSITFFKDIIVGSDPSDTFGSVRFQVTYATCFQAQNGMTWIHSASDAQTGAITVGCNGCNPYNGDTACTQALPLLCIYKPATPFPLPIGLSNLNPNYLWSGGVIATTQPVVGSSILNTADATSRCVAKFGSGWRIAEFHDGWGWNFQAFGGTVSAPTVPSTHFWVYINDQSANCWPP
jgi:hypothetical protein